MFFPLFLKLNNRKCIVVGGGKVAERKLAHLASSGAEIVLISPVINDNIRPMADNGQLTWISRGYNKGDIKGAFMVFITTDDRNINKLIREEAAEADILVNVADKPDECDFIYPSIIERGDLTIAVSTGGKSPAMCKRVREQIEKNIGREYEQYLELAGDLRQKVKNKLGSTQETDAFDRFFASDILQLLSQNKIDEAKDRMEKCI